MFPMNTNKTSFAMQIIKIVGCLLTVWLIIGRGYLFQADTDKLNAIDRWVSFYLLVWCFCMISISVFEIVMMAKRRKTLRGHDDSNPISSSDIIELSENNGGEQTAPGIYKTHFTDSELYTVMWSAEHNEDAFVCYLSGAWCETEPDFLHMIAVAMRFPGYYGENWNACDECITDLEWLKFSRILIVIDDFEKVFKRENSKDKRKEHLIVFFKR